jgi:hypothetical protein
VWGFQDVQWEEGFRNLEQFHQREGHCRVPQQYCEKGYRLGQWVGNQRTKRDKGKLSQEERQRLDALGFVWNVGDAQWEEGFRYLEKFHQREGHCQVPATRREGRFGLGRWVRAQRASTKTLSPERRQRLDALGFVWKVRS